MFRLLLAVALSPLSAALLWAAAKTLADVTLESSTSAPFAAGLGLVSCVWVLGRYLLVSKTGVARWIGRAASFSYVLGHELTHALASWGSGGSVYAIAVGEKEGHVDLSHSSAFVALAPYCFPLYSFAVAVGYRLLLWIKPDAGGEALFLFLMGATLAAHFLMTWDSLTQVRQPDLTAAGGVVFSWVLIVLANGLMVMLLLKGLFPGAVPLLERLREAALWTVWVWSRAARESWRLGQSVWRVVMK